MSLKDNRLSDIAALWIKVLTPWDTYNHYIDASINVHSCGFKNIDIENKYQAFLNPGYIMSHSTLLNIG
jgi:hypothetical protein